MKFLVHKVFLTRYYIKLFHRQRLPFYNSDSIYSIMMVIYHHLWICYSDILWIRSQSYEQLQLQDPVQYRFLACLLIDQELTRDKHWQG